MEENFTTDENNLSRARTYIEDGKLEKAQEIIDKVDTHNAEGRFLQGKLFMEKCWFSEARRCYKDAVKFDPSNAEYRQALDELNEFRKTKEYKEAKREAAKRQMGSTDGLAATCCLCGCEACGSGCCDAMCDGCS